MATLTKRQKQIGFAVVVLFPLLAFLVSRLFGGPTPEQARAALAEKKLCAVNAPIEKHEGKLFIGNLECDLSGRKFQGRGEWGEFAYESTPTGGRWIVSSWWHRGSFST